MAKGIWRRIFGEPPVITHGAPAEPKRQDVPRAPERRERRVEAKELPPFVVGAATEASPKHPDVNQDAFAVDAGRQMLMVADGVGSSANGEVASGAAREAMAELGGALDEMIQDNREEAGVPHLTLEQASDVMDAHFRMMADRVKEAADRNVQANVRSATTLMTAKIFETAPDETWAVVKSVGDCQPMVLRANGRLERVDIDEDSMFAERIRRGELSEDEAYMISESASSAEFVRTFLEDQAEQGIIHPDVVTGQWDLVPEPVRKKAEALLKYFNRYYSGAKQERSIITQFVGGSRGSELSVHTATVKLNPGDKLFLTTDGIDALKRAQVREALGRGATLDQQSQALVAAAKRENERVNDREFVRAKPDDITVVGLEVPRKETRSSQKLVEAGYGEDVEYAQETLQDLLLERDAFRDAHPELDDLDVLDAGSNDAKSRAAYIKVQNKYARQEGGLDAWRRSLRPLVAQETALESRIEAMRSELVLAQARQQLFDTEQDALKQDPDSPVWKRRVANAAERVNQLKRVTKMNRAASDVKNVEAARQRALSIAKES